MIKTQTMPKETLAELLLFLAENETFQAVAKDLEGSVSVDEARAVLRELGHEIAREAAAERNSDYEAGRKNLHLSPKAKKIISYLSPSEEKALLKAFGLAE